MTEPDTIEKRVENIAVSIAINADFEARAAIERAVELMQASGLEVPFITRDNLQKMEAEVDRRAS